MNRQTQITSVQFLRYMSLGSIFYRPTFPPASEFLASLFSCQCSFIFTFEWAS